MVQSAWDAGHPKFNERLLTEWVKRGLLDEAQRLPRGKGRGRGAYFEWPESQRQLLLSILEQRSSVKTIGALCNIPVGIWIYWGEEYVPLRQVKKAVRTWGDRAKKVGGWASAKAGARRIISSVMPTDVSTQLSDALVEIVARSLYSNQFLQDEIIAKIREHELTMRKKGKSDFSTELTLRRIEEMIPILFAIQNFDSFSDEDFENVRNGSRHAASDYIRNWRSEAQNHPSIPFETPTWEFFIGQSCSHLLVGLGMKVIKIQRGEAVPLFEPIDGNTPPGGIETIPMR
jgi:hypothetical protein